MKPSIEEAYHSGMIDFEQICEKVMEEIEFLPPNARMFIQVRILDEAQRRLSMRNVIGNECALFYNRQHQGGWLRL